MDSTGKNKLDKASGKNKDGIRSKLIVVAGRWEKSTVMKQL